ncbi:hypothetical protein GOP47_0024085, partial [Adiantum capillus-veneris]
MWLALGSFKSGVEFKSKEFMFFCHRKWVQETEESTITIVGGFVKTRDEANHATTTCIIWTSCDDLKGEFVGANVDGIWGEPSAGLVRNCILALIPRVLV